jgi:hypothetical protein
MLWLGSPSQTTRAALPTSAGLEARPDEAIVNPRNGSEPIEKEVGKATLTHAYFSPATASFVNTAPLPCSWPSAAEAS